MTGSLLFADSLQILAICFWNCIITRFMID